MPCMDVIAFLLRVVVTIIAKEVACVVELIDDYESVVVNNSCFVG